MIRLPPAARALIAFPNRSWGSRPRLYAAVRSADCDSSTILVPLRALAHGSVDFGESRSGDRECLNRGLGLLPVIAAAPSGLDCLEWVRPQGSESLALGLTLAAAPQLFEGLRLISSSCD